jgi:hypothetical protein
MIVKELDPLPPNASRQHQAGRRAEEQMAFYLRRAFGEETTVNVLNGLRVERQGEVAQIDHLLITPHGFILIESKSVTTKIRVNDQGEWLRQVGPGWQGMPSPLLQVERQADLLRALLNDHTDRFFRKVLGLQFTFKSVPFDGLVAISDTGVIQRPRGFATDQVLKADQITGRIQTINEDYRRASGLFSLSLNNPGADWSSKTIKNLIAFLLEQHTPAPMAPDSPSPANQHVAPGLLPWETRPAPNKAKVASAPQPNPASPPAQPVSKPISPTPAPQVTAPPVTTLHRCRACGSQQLTIVYGKFGYYFKCADCDGNTPIKVTGANGEKAKLTKRGREFYVVTTDATEPQLFYVNPQI